MGKIKIHELAKELDLPSKEVLQKAKNLNIDVSSHLSNIDDEQADKIRKAYKNKNNPCTVIVLCDMEIQHKNCLEKCSIQLGIEVG